LILGYELNMQRAFKSFALVVALAGVLSCAGNDRGWVELQPAPQSGQDILPTFLINGTIQYVNVEAGLFVIRDAEDRKFNPINLPDAFKRDGLVVEAEARRRDDLESTTMVGPMVELVRIRARE
jgi:hypothetical protein